jgi:4-alpha-glucanotransferase
MFERSSGVLLHPTSFPGPYGTGDLGEAAYRFIDFLADAGQHLWQVLPLGPPGYAGSPYDTRSSFAGSSLLIALEPLVEMGLLAPDDVRWVPATGDETVGAKERQLRKAFDQLDHHAGILDDVGRFRDQNAYWLSDYALYRVLSDAHQGRPWYAWDEDLVQRKPEALDAARRRYSVEIRFQSFLQYLFARQWGNLKRYAHDRGVHIIGDIPIFVAHDSADVWAHQGVFILDAHGQPLVVAGVPPDLFSETGQRWGNPCYRWDVMRESGYRWWIDRFRRTLELTDVVRVDHFRGFAAGWQIPADQPNAVHGHWVPGPGLDFFERVAAELGRLPIIVEDLGLITDDVIALREQLGYPGMKVLQFAFGDDHRNPYLPHNYERNAVVYTGTHDNDTTRGWFASCSPWERDHVLRYLGTNGDEIHWDLIRLALASVATLAIVPLQDVLGLGSEARMNVPARMAGNWRWRYRVGDLTPELAHRLADLTRLYGRGS